jgi:hypothetical protein
MLNNITFNFTPVAGIVRPVQVRFQFVNTGDHSVIYATRFRIFTTGASEACVFNGVDGLPDDTSVVVILAAAQDENGTWQEQIITPGVDISPETVLSFDGYQVGVA